MSPSICFFFLIIHLFVPPKPRCTRSRAVAVAPRNSHPEKQLQWDPSALFRKTKRGETLQFSLLRSHSSLMALKCIIMQMWILILNLRRGCLFFFQKKKKKKVPYVVSIASLFCKWIVNYAFCKGGVGDEDSFAKLFRSFCVHGRSVTIWGWWSDNLEIDRSSQELLLVQNSAPGQRFGETKVDYKSKWAPKLLQDGEL